MVNKYYNDSANTATEYWLFSDKKFYSASSPNSFNNPVFNGNFLNDTCTSFGSPSICYTIFDSILFNQNYYCQNFSEGFFNHSGGNATQVLTAIDVGIFFSYYSAFSFVPPFNDVKDSIILVGFINEGTLRGDSILTDISDTHSFISSFNLYQNYPNPFNPGTKISFSVPTFSPIKLLVYDVIGNEITTLVDEEKYPGYYTVNFNGTNFPSSVYFYRLITNSISITKKFLLLK